MTFFSLFALMVPLSLCRHDMWQKRADGPRTGGNTGAHGSARQCGAMEFFADFSRDWHEKLWAKCFWEASPYYASEMARAHRETHDIRVRILLVTVPFSIPLSHRNHCMFVYNIVLKSLKSLAPDYEAPIRHESCQTTRCDVFKQSCGCS